MSRKSFSNGSAIESMEEAVRWTQAHFETVSRVKYDIEGDTVTIEFISDR